MDKKTEYLVRYVCYACGQAWHEVHFYPCESDCPECGSKTVCPDNYCELESDTIVFINDNQENGE